MLKGKKQATKNFIYTLPMLLIMALVNPAFNHEGITILAYFPSGNPLTLESVFYGLCTALMIASVILHFSCYNEVMTSDRFLYLFGKVIPGMSLIISMTLRFVPRFLSQLRSVTNAQRCLGRDVSQGNIVKRAKHGLSILSIMTTWALENAIDTADSMKSRGYGLAKRTAYSIFPFDTRDKTALFVIFGLGIYTFIGTLLGKMSFRFFPEIAATDIDAYSISVLVSYFLLCICPVIIELWEVRKWNALKSKI